MDEILPSTFFDMFSVTIICTNASQRSESNKLIEFTDRSRKHRIYIPCRMG